MYQPHWHLSLVTPPTEEPLTLPEAKVHARVTQSEDDEYIADLITLAREYVELNIPGGRQLCTATYDLVLDGLPCSRQPLELPKPPLQSVTSITYYDLNNVSTVMPSSDYVVTAPTNLPGYIQPAVDVEWPETECRRDAVTIRFVAGYGGASAVPMRAKHAMRLLVGESYMKREVSDSGDGRRGSMVVPFGVDQLLNALGWGFVS